MTVAEINHIGKMFIRMALQQLIQRKIQLCTNDLFHKEQVFYHVLNKQDILFITVKQHSNIIIYF